MSVVVTTEEKLKREVAHAIAATLDATLWPNWSHPIGPAKRKSVPRRWTAKFKIAQAHRPGHGRLS